MIRDTYIQRKKLTELCPDQNAATFSKNFAELLGLRYDSEKDRVYFFNDDTDGLNMKFNIISSNKVLNNTYVYFGETSLGYTMNFSNSNFTTPTDGSDSLVYYYIDEDTGIKMFGIGKKNQRVRLNVAITTEYNPIDFTTQDIVIITSDVLGTSGTSDINIFRNKDGSVYITSNFLGYINRLCPIGLLVPIIDTSTDSIVPNFYSAASLPIGSSYPDACVFKMGNENYIAMSDAQGNIAKICFKLSGTDIDPSIYYDNKLIPVLSSNNGENGIASCPLKSPLYNGISSATDMRAYYAFDNNTSTHLEYFGENQSGAWCRYDFTNPIHLLRMTAIIGHYNTGNVYGYQLQYLKDGTEDTWVDVGSGVHTGNVSTVDHQLSEPVITSAVRFYSSSTKYASSNIFLYELQAYGW